MPLAGTRRRAWRNPPGRRRPVSHQGRTVHRACPMTSGREDVSLVRFGIHCNRPGFGGATLPWTLPDPVAGPNPHALCVAGSKDDRSCCLRLANAPRPLIAWASAVFPFRARRSRRPAITSSRPVKDGFLGWGTFQSAGPPSWSRQMAMGRSRVLECVEGILDRRELGTSGALHPADQLSEPAPPRCLGG